MPSYLVAVDVGTRSARAGVFDTSGHMLARAVAPLGLTEGPGPQAEYSSDQIWDAVCAASRAVVTQAGIAPDRVIGLAFDATCSLVLRDRDGAALSLGAPDRDTIAWFDHRALAEAAECTATGHRLIDHLGGAMSPEMQTPKLMWLKRHRPDAWARLGAARDLCDELTLRATGEPGASACARAAKWPYLPAAGGWAEDFLAQVGLDDLRERADLPAKVVPVGAPAGRLTPQAARAMGLAEGIPVASGMIDAYAGALGTVGLSPGASPGLMLITGTSNCIMAVTPDPLFAPGIWGPSRDTVLPGLWTSEGGQSAAGAALEWVLDAWPGPAPGQSYDHDAVLARIETVLAREGAALGQEIDVLPDFNGNRSPFSDAGLRGVIAGLSLDRGFDALCKLYWRTAVSVALGVRQIAEHLADAPSGTGTAPRSLAIAGGLARAPVLRQLFADVTGMKVLTSQAEDVVLSGTAIAAAVASGHYPDLATATPAMTTLARVLTPDPARHECYDRDFRIMLKMQDHRAEIAAMKARI